MNISSKKTHRYLNKKINPKETKSRN